MSLTKGKGIRWKLIRAHILLMLVMLCTLLLSALMVFTSGIRQESLYFLENNVELVAGQLDNLVSAMENCSNAAMLNLNQESVLARTGPGSDELSRYNAITRQLFLVGQVHREVDALVFVGEAGRLYSTIPELEAAEVGAYLSRYGETINTAGGKSLGFGIVPDAALPGGSGAPVLLTGKKVIRIETGATLGYLYIMVWEDSIARQYAEQRYTPNSRFFLCDLRGTVLSAWDKALIGQPLPIEPGSGGEFWDWNDGVPLAGYRMPVPEVSAEIVYTAPVVELYSNVLSLMGVIFLLAVGGVIVTIYLARYIAGRFSLPVLRLVGDMRQAEDGNLAVRCMVKSDDEVGLLADGFNRMLANIGELLDTVKREQKEKARQQITLLQNQIKPHFLYNTLNTIYTLCMMDDSERAGGAAKSLAEYYRHSLSGGRNMISVTEELACVESYLAIQRLVLRDHLKVDIACDPELGQYLIPKMTLQPIVENAVLHGIKPKDAGTVSILVDRQGDNIRIRVEDDGVGIEKESAAALLDAECRLAGFGLKNVKERLALYTGSRAAIGIASTEGAGTTVTITVPTDVEGSNHGGVVMVEHTNHGR